MTQLNINLPVSNGRTFWLFAHHYTANSTNSEHHLPIYLVSSNSPGLSYTYMYESFILFYSFYIWYLSGTSIDYNHSTIIDQKLFPLNPLKWKYHSNLVLTNCSSRFDQFGLEIKLQWPVQNITYIIRTSIFKLEPYRIKTVVMKILGLGGYITLSMRFSGVCRSMMV